MPRSTDAVRHQLRHLPGEAWTPNGRVAPQKRSHGWRTRKSSTRVTDAIGHLPEAGEELTVGRFHFRVGRADQRRVHSFIVSIQLDA